MKTLKKNRISRLYVSLLLIVSIVGCEDQQKVKPITPNLSGIKPGQYNAEQERNAKAGRVGVTQQIFAWQGDYLYRVHPDTKEVEYYGNGWSNTEAASVYGNFVWAVQGDRLWKCDLNTTACQDLGGGWSGTTHLEVGLSAYNSQPLVMAIHQDDLYKINHNNGSYTWLSNGWSTATDIANETYYYHYYPTEANYAYWFIKKADGRLYKLDGNGFSTGTSVVSNLKKFSEDENAFWGITDTGDLVHRSIQNLFNTVYLTNAFPSGTAIGHVNTGTNRWIYVLQNGVVHFFHWQSSNGVLTNLSPVAGLNNVYYTTSTHMQ